MTESEAAELDNVVAIYPVPSVSDIENALIAHRSEIVEAHTFGPLAAHVRAIILACLKGEQGAKKRGE